MKIGKGLRWKIVWILFSSTALNYVNRQTFSLLAPVISKSCASAMKISHASSALFKSFMPGPGCWAAFFDLGRPTGPDAGRHLVVDRQHPVERGQLAALVHFCRALLGVGEGMNWPGASKVVAEWFPAKERGVAVAIFDSGSSIGAAIAAVTVPLVALKFGWRSAFVLSGLLGGVWLVFWLKTYHPVGRHPKLDARERSLIREDPRPLPYASAGGNY